jgi:hypothetical protein
LAGLGRKEFNSGDILLASEVQGYLQDQAVMVFNDATARGSAIPSPSEGMLTYNKDTDQLELYDGSAFGPVGSDAGLIHIETRTLTATSFENFNNVFSSTYDNYRILIRIIVSTSTNIQIRLRVGGIDNGTASSYVTQNLLANSTTVSASRNTDTSGQLMGVETNLLTLGLIDISQPFLASPTGWYTLNMLPISNASLRNWAGTHNQTISYDGFTIFPGSGNITGQISIYGYAKA